jgi:RNA polymerase sigma factor (sigma-70 family)
MNRMTKFVIMQNIPDHLWLERLKTEDSEAFAMLYKSCFPSIAKHIKQNNGNNSDAEDIFQEAVVVLLKNIRHPDFVLSSSLQTYLYAISKNLWLKHLRNHKTVALEGAHTSGADPFQTEAFSIDLVPEKTKEEKVFTWLENITLNCQYIIKALFLESETMQSLMAKMGWRNKHTADNQKYKCIQQLKKESKKG